MSATSRTSRQPTAMAMQRDAYQVLQVPPSAGDDAIRSAYRTLARDFHPDGRRPDPGRMAEINLAYHELKTPGRRREYDARRFGRPAGAVAEGRPSHAGDTTTIWSSAGPSPVQRGSLLHRIAAAEAADSPTIDFGQYAGWRIGDVARVDPRYLRWLSRHSAGVRYGKAIEQALGPDPELGRTPWVRSAS